MTKDFNTKPMPHVLYMERFRTLDKEQRILYLIHSNTQEFHDMKISHATHA